MLEILIPLILILLIFSISLFRIKKVLENETKKLKINLINKEKDFKTLENSSKQLEEQNNNLKQCIIEKDEHYKDLDKFNNDSIKKIITLHNDFLLFQFDISSKYLENKSRPANVEAKRIKELKQESRLYLEQYKLMLYKYEYLLNIFPELLNYVDDISFLKELEDKQNIEKITNEDYVSRYITKEQYAQLDDIQRNQLALDNYIKGKKTNWQIGRDYELFCGQHYQNLGWNVTYFGMEQKLKDLGRDLIAVKDDKTLIVQCKYWSKDKLIHEKHILQLFATTYIYKVSTLKSKNNCKAVFITNTALSDTAKEFAKILNVEIIQMQLSEFPRIKCNVNRDSFGESKIYHLPFDQKYDFTHIKNKGEFYAYTVKEAVDRGFRRALKYYG